MAMFLAEVLSLVLRESVPDAGLYDYVAASARYLDSMPTADVANFHICFLLHLGRLLGIEPDVSTYAPGSVLDMRDGNGENPCLSTARCLRLTSRRQP